MQLLCPECNSDQIEVMTPPPICGYDYESGYYEIDPPSTWLCMDCRATGDDIEGDVVVHGSPAMERVA